jgi:hypothetical protein
VARTERSNQRARETFLAKLTETCCVLRSAEAAGINRVRLYEMRAADPEFAEAWAKALDAGTDVLEAEAIRRAVEGVDEPVFQGGELVGHVRKYSDTLLARLLDAHKPEKYRQRSEVKHTGSVELAGALEAARKRVNGDELT